jgi:hypothetical protein
MLETSGDLNLPEKAVGTEGGDELLAQELDGNRTVVLKVAGEVDGGHPTPAELPLDHVAIAQGVSQLGSRPLDHGLLNHQHVILPSAHPDAGGGERDRFSIQIILGAGRTFPL